MCVFFIWPLLIFLDIIVPRRACTRCESCREHRLYDGSLLHPSRKNSSEAPLLVGKSLGYDLYIYFLTLRRGSTLVKQQH